MENIMEVEEILRKVCKQRDQTRDMLGILIDRFWAAHYNHAFDAEDRKDKEVDGKTVEYKCSAGKTLKSLFRGCDLFNKEGICKGWDCPLGFNHRNFYEAVLKARKVLDERPVELIPFVLERIPKYDPKKKYTVSAKWFARMCFMFLNWFEVGEEYTEEESRRIGDALASLVCIGLSSLGLGCPIDFIGLNTDDPNALKEDDPRLASFKTTMEAFNTRFEEKIREFDTLEIASRKQKLEENDEVTLALIIYRLVTVMCEYAFGHEYPSADLAVYQDIFHSIKFDCAVVMGIEGNNYTVIKNINNTWLDEIGFKAE